MQKDCWHMAFCLITKTLLIGKEGTGLLRKSESKGDIPGAKGAEEAYGPPAESECLRWNSTVNVQIPQNCGQSGFKRSFHAELTGTEGARLLREYECRGDTAGANAEEAPRTARGGIQRSTSKLSKKTVDQLDGVCLQYEINNRNKKTMYSIL